MLYKNVSVLLLALALLLAAYVPAESPEVKQLPTRSTLTAEQPTNTPGETGETMMDPTSTPDVPENTADGEITPAPTPDANAETEEAETGPAPSTVPQEPVTVAIQDLARRLNVNAEQIELREVRVVTWPDASLGCPQPGIAYIQVPQDGLLIRLAAGGETYHYHSSDTEEPFLCQETAELLNVTPKPGDEFIPHPGFDE